MGGEYGAGWKSVGAGRLVTTFFPEDGSQPIFCDDRILKDKSNVVVTYHNPLDNVEDLAHHFFSRCLADGIVPYVVTKKTVFKWQEGFWTKMKEVFDMHYKQKYMDAKILPDGKLQHLISDAATMQVPYYLDREVFLSFLISCASRSFQRKSIRNIITIALTACIYPFSSSPFSSHKQ